MALSAITGYDPATGQYYNNQAQQAYQNAISPLQQAGLFAPGVQNAAPAAHQQQPQKKGFLGKVFGAGKALAKGATVGLGKSILSPKGLLTIGAGIALTVATGGAAAPFLIAAGIGLSAKGVAENGMTAYQLYKAGRPDLAEKALENVGTNLASGALAVAGARSYTGNASVKGAVTDTFKQVKTTSSDAILNVRTHPNGITGAASEAFGTGRANLTNYYNGQLKPAFTEARAVEGGVKAQGTTFLKDTRNPFFMENINGETVANWGAAGFGTSFASPDALREYLTKMYGPGAF